MDVQLRSFEERFCGLLVGIVRKLCRVHECKPVGLLYLELMLVFTVELREKSEICFVGQLTGATAQSGPNEAAQVCLQFRIVGTEDYVGVHMDTLPGRILRPLHRPYIDTTVARTASRDYLSSHGKGAHLTCTKREMTLHCLRFMQTSGYATEGATIHVDLVLLISTTADICLKNIVCIYY